MRALSLRAGAALLVVLLAFTTAVTAQQRRSNSARNELRAIGVLEFPETGEPRLVPVAILVEGRYYDAGIYKAAPVPMTLAPGTVYEARRAGEPVGFFTVTTPMQLRRNWVALGTWQPNQQEQPESTPAEPAPAGPPPVDPDAPPVLRRNPSAAAQPPQKPAETPATSTPGAPDPGTPDPGPAPTTTPPSPPSADRDGPPVLRRPQAPASTNPPATGSQSAGQTSQAQGAPATERPVTDSGQEDPNRPRLRRNMEPAPSQVENIKDPLPSGPAAAKTTWKVKEALPAVSDTRDEQLRNYRFDWHADEQERLQRAAETLAGSALKNYSETRAHIAAGPLENIQVDAFNLDFSNIPYIVLTASAPPAANAKPAAGAPTPPADFRFHVTIIARESPNRELRLVMASVTDSTRLDVFPQLELAGTVDADADGRAELMFAETSDLGRAYKLYRMVGDNASELFASSPIRDTN